MARRRGLVPLLLAGLACVATQPIFNGISIADVVVPKDNHDDKRYSDTRETPESPVRIVDLNGTEIGKRGVLDPNATPVTVRAGLVRTPGTDDAACEITVVGPEKSTTKVLAPGSKAVVTVADGGHNPTKVTAIDLDGRRVITASDGSRGTIC